MTHKQVKFGKSQKSQKVKPVEEEYEGGSAYQRAVLLRPNDVGRMAVESARARLINHLVSKAEDDYATREFASYYHGSTRYVEPPFSITSHTNKVYIPKALQVIPTYPSLIPAPQWCPNYAQPPEQNSQTDLMMDRKNKCRCIECRSLDCNGKGNSNFKPRRIKDNIMTFCDRYTMTRKLNDAGCGCTPASSCLNCPSVSVAVPCDSTMGSVKDLQGKLKSYEMSNKLGFHTPVPILKKGVNNEYCMTKFQKKQDNIEPQEPTPVQCYFRKEEDSETICRSTRKNIYNEGISDVVLKFPSVPKKGPGRSASPVCSKATVSSDWYTDSDNEIPHSLMCESKYHKNCVEKLAMPRPAPKRQLPIPNPKITACKTCSGKGSKHQQRIIRLPKRVLTSEKVAVTSAPQTAERFKRK